MRIVRELVKEGIRISVFSWNNKYLLKFEDGMIEQTFKVSELDLTSEKDIDFFFEGEFWERVKKRSDEMHQMLRNQLGNM
ncbi:hypothetical protein [Lunatibacter salilacus]|uniref:hypothetical protein n=1 Tax=Lunatibacter salilacus TaxID=2483804 RepID=UPI00131D0139|nr:hypothetical protein [Lunatibacter salilacus]